MLARHWNELNDKNVMHGYGVNLRRAMRSAPCRVGDAE